MRALIQSLEEMSSRVVRKKLKKAGCKETSQRGSHLKVKCPVDKQGIVPVHKGKDIPKGTLKSISRQTGVKL
jgi:predicted RNA binding protein YcfA (HicA-like mRNA interferase family)